jgi:hypothetical protein
MFSPVNQFVEIPIMVAIKLLLLALAAAGSAVGKFYGFG